MMNIQRIDKLESMHEILAFLLTYNFKFLTDLNFKNSENEKKGL